MSEYIYEHVQSGADHMGKQVELPTLVQREEIVRRRDCEYYHDGTSNGRRYSEPHCLAIGELAYGALFEVDEDCFCSWGERKEVGE